MKYLLILLKVLLSILILLFALATYFGRSYLQTISLILIVIALFYWPILTKNEIVSTIARYSFIALMLIFQFTVFKGEPKQSIYLSETLQNELYTIYDSKMEFWPSSTEQLFINTKYGKVHVLTAGNNENPPLLLFHAASMGAHSWAENLEPLLENYRIYAIDNIGEGNLSVLNDATVFPNTPEEIADLYAEIANELGVEKSPVFGASNGGYIAQVYAYYYPEKVESLALFGPMGLTQLSGKSIFMLSAATMYPLDWVREKVVYWAFGDDNYSHEKYGDWFDIIMKGTMPSIAQPVPMTVEQKNSMEMSIILFLGTNDPIVGDAEIAKSEAEHYPNIDIYTLQSGHIIAVEQRDFINKKIIEFLNK